MGKHKNSTTLEFLALLRERGSVHNFVVEEEYPLMKGVFIADLVYKLPSYNGPIISFEVESSPTSYIIKNAVKYFSTKSTEIPKPWHHFIVILKGILKPSDKKSLECITEKHNVHFFENVLVDKNEHKRFDEKIEEMSKAFEQIEENRSVSTEFKIGFSTKVGQCVSLIEKNSYEAQDAIDELIMLFKERIEKWDVPSVRFATTEVFERFYEFSSKKQICELYQIFKDLFEYAYSQRKQLIGAMISSFSNILLEAWIK